jgi:hypothetical protein
VSGPRRLASLASHSHARSRSHEVRRCLVLGGARRGVAWHGTGATRCLMDLRSTSPGEKRLLATGVRAGAVCSLHRPHPKLKCTMIQDQ